MNKKFGTILNGVAASFHPVLPRLLPSPAALVRACRKALRLLAIAGLATGLAAPLGAPLAPAYSAATPQETASPQNSATILQAWYRLVLELVRHTPTYTPPVASRAFAYLGITAHEVAASGNGSSLSLAGQLNGLTPLPARGTQSYNDDVILQAALASAAHHLFDNTGPMGQRAMNAVEAKLRAAAIADVPSDIVARSEAYGQALAAHILDWAAKDGGETIENMGFPYDYALKSGPAHWVPTSAIIQQQKPLLPDWGKNRPFAMPAGASCDLPPPPAYSEDPTSELYRQALEVRDAVKNLTPEQRSIARYWSDDAMLTVTPPGHWVSIALQVMERDQLPFPRRADILARVGIAVADAFIGCWHTKYEYDWLRPVTYIRRVIEPKWEALLITPPFPEYPSGHSSESAAAAVVLTAALGEGVAFHDATYEADDLGARDFKSFWDAANEAGISRLYGGIHFRPAIERGIDQGRCIGAYAAKLRTQR